MAGPWEAYQTAPADGPWTAYQQPQQSQGTTLGDVGRMAMTVGVGGLRNVGAFLEDPFSPVRRLFSPSLENMVQSARPHPSQEAANAVFAATGVPEYQPTTPLGRTAMAAGQGLVGGAPFGLAGAGLSALSGALGQGMQEATGSERWATAAGLAPGIAAGGLSAMRTPQRTTPTAPELKSAGVGGYGTARNSGVEFHGNAVADMASNVRAGLEADGIFDVLAPKTHAILDKASSPPPGAVSTVANLLSLRRSLGRLARETSDGKATEDAMAATTAIHGLDPFMESPDPAAVAAGTPAEAAAVGDILREANANYAASQRSNTLVGGLSRARQGILERAEGRAAAANSGRNLDNSIRSRVESLRESLPRNYGFTDDELAALDRIVEGTPYGARNSARYWGNFLGGGGGMHQALTASGGALGGGLLGHSIEGAALGAAVPPLAGAALKGIENTMSRRALLGVDEMTRQRSPLYEQQQMPSHDIAVLRALLPGLLGYQPQGQGGLLGR